MKNKYRKTEKEREKGDIDREIEKGRQKYRDRKRNGKKWKEIERRKEKDRDIEIKKKKIDN